MWINAEIEQPEASGWYLCVFKCNGHHGCGRTCAEVRLMRYDAEHQTAAVYGTGCIFHGNVIYDVPVGVKSCARGYVTHWLPLPERP